MIVRHHLRVTAVCPVDGLPDVYEATVETSRVIRVEDILAAADQLRTERIYQEDLTVRLARALGAQVTTIGWHSGIRTEVIA